MMKNTLDVVFGGITYWAFGFGLSFGADKGSNGFTGVGCFFVDADESRMGYVFAVFLFQLSFATTATTIVSGSMTERTKLCAYILFSLLSPFIYSIPAHWIWSREGFLYRLGAIDVAGCGPVHLVGGLTGLVATVTLKPRTGAFKTKQKPPIPSPLKCILGMFMLWWVQFSITIHFPECLTFQSNFLFAILGGFCFLKLAAYAWLSPHLDLHFHEKATSKANASTKSPSPDQTIDLVNLWQIPNPFCRWGWLRFSSGSVFIMSSEAHWKNAVRWEHVNPLAPWLSHKGIQFLWCGAWKK